MIDNATLTQALPHKLSDSSLRAIDAVQPRGRSCYAINPTQGERLPSLTFKTQPNGIMYCSARFSLPSLLFGHNSRLPNQSEVYQALNLASNLIERRTGLDFNPVTANVTEVHFTRDFILPQDRIVPTLHALRTRRLSRKKPTTEGDTSLYWKAKQSQICVYSKWHQAGDDQSKGILRLEYRLSREAVVNKQKSMKLKDRTPINILSGDVSQVILDGAMTDLQLQDAIEGINTDPALKRLCEYYKATQAWRLYGFLKMLETYGEHFYRMPWLGVQKATYFRNLNECRKAKVWTSH